MKSNEIYTLVGILVLIAAFVWWGFRGEETQEVIGEETKQEETTNTNPTPKPSTSSAQTPKPSSPATQSQSSVNPTVVPEKPVPVTPTSKSLAGSTFRLTTYKGSPVPADSKFTLTFTENNFSLKLCNTLSSRYYIDGNFLKADNVVSTLMYCSSPSNIMQIESDASFMLNSGVTTIYKSGSTLIFSHPQGIVLSFEGF
jgi:heat shock protein HslJ